jgi:signal peptidase II
MKSGRSHYLVVVLAVAATAAGLDQVAKWIAAEVLTPGQPLALIPGVLDLNLRANPHGAFGLFASFPPDLRLPVLLALGVLAMLAIVTFSIRTLGWSTVNSIALGLILGGAISNLADRALRGEVLDFIDIHIGSQGRWPTFNLADIAITAGSLALVGVLIATWLKKRKEEDIPEN